MRADAVQARRLVGVAREQVGLEALHQRADELDEDWPDANEWVEFGDRQARGVTGYLLRTGEPQLITHERHMELFERGEIERAVRCGFWCGYHLQNRGEIAQAQGWEQRLARLMTGVKAVGFCALMTMAS